MLIFYPKLPNGNILWTWDNCGNTAQVSFSDTNAVALYCACNYKVNPQCNDEWYNESLYMKRIPMEIRLKRCSRLRELYERDENDYR